jgi:8-oxo-dGTP diphosphatase
VVEQDGDGWAHCDGGHTHWGRFGAVGLLAYCAASAAKAPGGAASAAKTPGGASLAAKTPDGATGAADARVLLVRRSFWSQHGGSWGPPGGARDSDEAPLAAALREAAEECGLPPAGVTVQGLLRDEHGGWSYQTFVARAAEQFPVGPASAEISQAMWADPAEVATMRLHPGFAASWPVLSQALTPVSVVVDVANVMGARADGWWRDRAGAARRLHDQIAALAADGLAGLPLTPPLPPLDLWFPDFVFVTEGATRRAELPPAVHVHVVRASGSGDDEIVAQATSLPGHRLVVTADRELRRRCQSAGAAVTGPSWLLAQLP